MNRKTAQRIIKEINKELGWKDNELKMIYDKHIKVVRVEPDCPKFSLKKPNKFFTHFMLKTLLKVSEKNGCLCYITTDDGFCAVIHD